MVSFSDSWFLGVFAIRTTFLRLIANLLTFFYDLFFSMCFYPWRYHLMTFVFCWTFPSSNHCQCLRTNYHMTTFTFVNKWINVFVFPRQIAFCLFRSMFNSLSRTKKKIECFIEDVSWAANCGVRCQTVDFFGYFHFYSALFALLHNPNVICHFHLEVMCFDSFDTENVTFFSIQIVDIMLFSMVIGQMINAIFSPKCIAKARCFAWERWIFFECKPFIAEFVEKRVSRWVMPWS